jgi:hypothetical protein
VILVNFEDKEIKLKRKPDSAVIKKIETSSCGRIIVDSSYAAGSGYLDGTEGVGSEYRTNTEP